MLPAIRRPTLFDIGRIFFVGAIWGGAFIFVTLALTDFGPVSISAWRVSLAAIVLIAIAFVSQSKFPRGARHWGYIFIVGCLNSAVPFFLISWGQQFISSAESALLMALGTFCALLISHFTSVDERINPSRALGVVVGFIGVLVLVFWDMVESGLGGIKGQLAVMAAGCSYATSTVIARRLTHLPPISTSAATLLSASLYMVPLASCWKIPYPRTLVSLPSSPCSTWELLPLPWPLPFVLPLFVPMAPYSCPWSVISFPCLVSSGAVCISLTPSTCKPCCH